MEKTNYFIRRTREGNSVLVQSVPGRSATLITISIPPGVWMSIIGMLSAPTCLMRNVCSSCGVYCTIARSADDTPRNVAHVAICGARMPVGESGT